MENRFTSEMIEKAKAAQSAEEILTLAKEGGYEMSDEEAKAYFEQFHKTGELSDEELDSVAGGGCHTKDGRLVVSAGMRQCKLESRLWKCECGSTRVDPQHGECAHCRKLTYCNNCAYCTYERGLWICNRDEMRG